MENSDISFKNINNIAIPAMIAGIAEPLIGLIDTAFAGNIDSNSSLAQTVVGLSASIYSILIWSLAQIRTSISSLISRFLGKGKLTHLKSLIPQTLVFSFIIGMIFMIISFVFIKDILHYLYGIEYNTPSMNYTVTFFKIRILAFPLSLLSYIAFGIFRGLQNMKIPMYISIVGLLSNALLNYTFIHYYEGYFQNQIYGIAIASVISQLIILVLFIYFLNKKTNFSILSIRKRINPFFREMLIITGNLILRTIALNFTFFYSNKVAVQYGDEKFAANTIIFNIWIFTFFLIDGYSNAGNSIGGKLFGQKNFKKIKLLINRLLIYNLYLVILLSILLIISYNYLILLFSNNPNVIYHFKNTFWIIIIGLFSCVFAFTYDGLLKGFGFSKVLKNNVFQASFLIFLPSILILDYFGMELKAVWISLIVWVSYRAIYLHFFINKWLNKKLNKIIEHHV